MFARLVIGLLVAFVVAVVLWYLSSTVTASLFRFLIAAAMGLGIAVFGIGFFGQMARAPAEPQPEVVPSEYRLAYICEMCGLELKVIKVAKDKAPKHCGEEMTLVQR